MAESNELSTDKEILFQGIAWEQDINTVNPQLKTASIKMSDGYETDLLSWKRFAPYHSSGEIHSKYDRLIDSIKGIVEQLPGKHADHFISVIDKCSLCEEYCDSDCPYCDESLEQHVEVFFQHVYDFLKDQGLYNEDGTVSEKGTRIRVSDTLALLMTTGLTKDSWTEERGGLLI